MKRIWKNIKIEGWSCKVTRVRKKSNSRKNVNVLFNNVSDCDKMYIMKKW